MIQLNITLYKTRNKKLFYFSFINLIIFGLILGNQLEASESKLTLSEEFYLIAINGKEHPKAQRQPSIVPLKLGFNKIALQYKSVWSVPSKNTISPVSSKTFIVSFYLAKKDNFRLTFLKPSTYLASLQFSKSPKVSFINKTRQGKIRRSLKLNISIPLNQRVENIVRITKANPGLKRSQSPIMITSKKQK
ncbi:MAG: hypothetical protein COB38_11020 [Gammaproteobacteria bacterium]|nr:MAG: hypothetical protein COB38_11020 [Gammaproteobacteria bacterium]